MTTRVEGGLQRVVQRWDLAEHGTVPAAPFSALFSRDGVFAAGVPKLLGGGSRAAVLVALGGVAGCPQKSYKGENDD